MITFAYTILFVKDVEQSLAFYEKAFGFKRKFIAPGNEYGELLTGSTALGFAATQLANTNLKAGFIESKPGGKPLGVEIAFATPDVDKALDKAITAGATLVEKPAKKPWGQTVAYITDLDGFLIELCTPIEE